MSETSRSEASRQHDLPEPALRWDDRLRQWAREHVPPAAELDRLREKILSQVPDGRPSPVAPAPRPPTPQLGRTRLLSLAAAAAVLLCVGGWWLTRQEPRIGAGTSVTTPPSVLSPSVPPEFAWLQRSQLAGKAVLLAEVERVFGDRLAWIAETNGHVSFGLTPDADRSRTPLAVRVVLVRRRDGAAAEPVWAVDLVARSEQVVRVVPEDAQGAEVLVWAYSLPDGKIAVDTNLALTAPVSVVSTQSGLQEDGVPTGVFTARHGDAEYELFQTVSVLESEVH